MTGIIAGNRKAIAAGLATLASTVLATAPDGITGNEWIVVAATTLGSFAAVWSTPANQDPATDAKPVTIPVADADGTIVGQTVVTGPSATIAHYEPPSRLDALDGAGRHEKRDDLDG